MKNSKKRSTLIAILLVFTLVAFQRCQHTQPNHPKATNTSNTEESIIPKNARLIYTKHARCRMACRNITEEEIHEVLDFGTINKAKSEQNNGSGTCPTYALEANTHEGQRLRIVFAKCDNVVKVVTCIDLDHEFECHCQ